MFSGGVKSKADILSEVRTAFASLTQNQLDQRLSNAAFERRIDAVTEISAVASVSESAAALPHGVSVGAWCSAILPSHEIVDAYLKRVIGDEACIRIRPWTLMRLPLSSLMQRLTKVA